MAASLSASASLTPSSQLRLKICKFEMGPPAQTTKAVQSGGGEAEIIRTTQQTEETSRDYYM